MPALPIRSDLIADRIRRPSSDSALGPVEPTLTSYQHFRYFIGQPFCSTVLDQSKEDDLEIGVITSRYQHRGAVSSRRYGALVTKPL